MNRNRRSIVISWTNLGYVSCRRMNRNRGIGSAICPKQVLTSHVDVWIETNSFSIISGVIVTFRVDYARTYRYVSCRRMNRNNQFVPLSLRSSYYVSCRRMNKNETSLIKAFVRFCYISYRHMNRKRATPSSCIMLRLT